MHTNPVYNSRNMKYLLSIWFLLGASLNFAQQITHKEAVEDLTFLADRIKQYNPALPHYHPEFDRSSRSFINQIPQEPISRLTFFSLVSQLCSMANEGHFQVHNWNDKLHKGFVDNTYAFLPLQVKIISKKIYVFGDFSDEQQFDRGDEIIAINGVQTVQILDELIKHMPSDGNILTYAYRKIEDRFSWLYYMYIEQVNTFEITFLDNSKTQKTITCNALTGADRTKNLRKFYPQSETNSLVKDEGFYSLDLYDKYAYLKLPSFDFRRINTYKVKSKKMYKGIFKELRDKEVEYLVIDLRNNTGGRNAFADDMVPFINKASISTPFLKKTISWEGKERVYKSPKPSKLSFQGNLYVLVNGKTFSAGSSLARFLKEYGKAIVIGEETGTRYEGFAAGSSQSVDLPHSGLSIGIPRYLIKYPSSSKQQTTNRGLLPDHELENRLENPDNVTLAYIKQLISLGSSDKF